jgi:hypothetical protein
MGAALNALAVLPGQMLDAILNQESPSAPALSLYN